MLRKIRNCIQLADDGCEVVKNRGDNLRNKIGHSGLEARGVRV